MAAKRKVAKKKAAKKRAVTKVAKNASKKGAKKKAAPKRAKRVVRRRGNSRPRGAPALESITPADGTTTPDVP